MATKKFDQIGGVKIKDNKTGEICLSCISSDMGNWAIISRGDTIFEIDVENRKIITCVVKYATKIGSGLIKLFYCPVTTCRDFIPTYNTFYSRDLPQGMKRCNVLYNKSVYGLLCTNITDAAERLQKINDGWYFGALKRGDKVYLVDKVNGGVVEEIVESIQYNNRWYNDNAHFNISTQSGLNFECYNSEYEENASVFSDPSFCINGHDIDNKKCSLHLNKDVAEKALREYQNNRKSVEKKRAEATTIPTGTPIRHKDNKGKTLHYGDLVSYVRKTWDGHTDISFGVIVGDSEKKIKVFDGEEVGKKKHSWSEKTYDGIHILDNANVLLVKEAVK